MCVLKSRPTGRQQGGSSHGIDLKERAASQTTVWRLVCVPACHYRKQSGCSWRVFYYSYPHKRIARQVGEKSETKKIGIEDSLDRRGILGRKETKREGVKATSV